MGEHLPDACLGTYLALLHQSNTKGIFLTWAPPSQGGHCHISKRPQSVVNAAMQVSSHGMGMVRFGCNRACM